MGNTCLVNYMRIGHQLHVSILILLSFYLPLVKPFDIILSMLKIIVFSSPKKKKKRGRDKPSFMAPAASLDKLLEARIKGGAKEEDEDEEDTTEVCAPPIICIFRCKESPVKPTFSLTHSLPQFLVRHTCSMVRICGVFVYLSKLSTEIF